MSHLLQMRGLKLKEEYEFEIARLSHLLQMRGLKPITVCHLRVMFGVASFTDAWIETVITASIIEAPKSRIFYRCVD